MGHGPVTVGRLALAAASALALLAAVTLVLAVPARARIARPAPPDPQVGAVFLAGSPAHYCTASVVYSPRHNLVATAAHCVVGDGTLMRFVPAQHDGMRPYGTWRVEHVYLHPAWIGRHDWQHDYAFLELAPNWWQGRLRNIEDVVGARRLATAPAPRQVVAVTGYVAGAGAGDKPITCYAAVYFHRGYPAFDCHGYSDGVSGSPWVANDRLRGVIGGFHQGGCDEATSYTSRFDADTVAVWRRAVSEKHPDVAPAPADDGC